MYRVEKMYVDTEKCIGCQRCIKACLFDVLREGGNGFWMSANKLSAMIIGSISVIIIIVIKIKTGEDHNGSK